MNIKFNVFDKIKNIDSQRELFIECFPENLGKNSAKISHYNWKFHSFPFFNEKSFEYAAFLDNELVGYYAAIPYQYTFKDKIFTVGMVCDVMTGVKARGKGVFTKLGMFSTENMKTKDIDFTMGYPIRSEVIPGHLKAGWDKVFELPLYIKFISFKPFLAKFRMGLISPIFDVFLVIYTCLRNLLFSCDDYSVKTIQKEDLIKEDLDSFFNKWKEEVPISLNKSQKFLNWRLGAPNVKYNINILLNKNTIVGYAISRNVIKEGIPVSAILDLCILKEYKKGLNKLISILSYNSKLDKNGALLFMCSKYQFKTHNLFANGFIPTPHKFWLIIKNLKGIDLSIIHKQENWQLNWIDSDDL